MDTQQAELHALAHHLDKQCPALLAAWRRKVRGDPALISGDVLPRFELDDHVPALLSAYSSRLRHATKPMPTEAESDGAAAHGSHRWRQGYDLHEVTRELGRLNELVVAELDAYVLSQPISPHTAALAHKIWAESHTHYAEQSTTQYFLLQRTEAAGHVRDLEQALLAVHDLERQRAELWRQIAHDLRGNIGVVADAASGLGLANVPADSRTKLLHLLDRNVGILKHFLDDVTELARLHAGQEHPRTARFDAAAVLTELCDGLQGYAAERQLYLRTQGRATLLIDGDAGKLRRIAQNLILNALKYTLAGGVTVTWDDCGAADPARWELRIEDTGPGLERTPLAPALDPTTEPPGIAQAANELARTVQPANPATPQAAIPGGEGIGLSIVKRLAEMLNASIEMASEPGKGTQFRVILPRQYVPPTHVP